MGLQLTLSLVLWLCHLARTYSWVPGQELAESKVKCLVQVPFPSWGTTSNDLPMQEGNLDTFCFNLRLSMAIPSWAICGTDSKASHFSSHHPAVLTPSQALSKEHSLRNYLYANIQLRVGPQRSRPKIKNKLEPISNEWWE